MTPIAQYPRSSLKYKSDYLTLVCLAKIIQNLQIEEFSSPGISWWIINIYAKLKPIKTL